MVTHDALPIKLKLIFLLAIFNRIEQHLSTLKARQAKLPIVATHSNVIAKVGF